MYPQWRWIKLFVFVSSLSLSLNIFQCHLTFTTLGIGPNMMLSKVCSDKNKPNGQYRLPSTRDAVMEFVQDLPVRKVQYTLVLLINKAWEYG